MLAFKYILPVGLSVLTLWFLPQPKTSEPNENLTFGRDSLPTDSVERSLVATRKKIDSFFRETKIPLDTPYKPSRYPYFRPRDRYSDPFSSRSNSSSGFYNFPNLIKTDVNFEPDSAGNRYEINEKIGKRDYRTPTLLTEKELQELQQEQDRKKLIQELSSGKNAETATTGKSLFPKIPIESPWFDRIFGPGGIEFKPVGFVNLDFAVQRQKVANPNLPIRQQRNTNFNFDPHANLNLTGKVGSKLQISGSFDTKASFQFENNFKLEYKGFEEDIIRKIEFGNVSFPLSTTLIQGAQNLFGVSTELQFGRLKVRSIYSNQRARAEQVTLKGGAQRRNFEVVAGDYEDNRHFFLTQYFRNNYEKWLSTLPAITSGMQITRMEVYITNRVNNTQDLRNVAAFLDLGEANPNNKTLLTNAQNIPSNTANKLFDNIKNLSVNADTYANELIANGLQNGTDFTVLRAARKLKSTEYTYNAQLGYISLLTPLRNDEVLAVAFEYNLNGRPYKIGDLTDDYANRDPNQIVRLKMLRPNQIRLDLPTWNLMMKNVYSLNASQVNRQNFLLRVIYKDDLTGIDNPTLQEGVRMKNQPLLRVMGLDQLNPQNDPQADGNFDYIEGVTIDSRNGRIYFPRLEPFGNNLKGTASTPLKFDTINESALVSKYVFERLYRSTKADALQTADKNKFFIQGSFEASASSDVTLPGINIPEGSVKVTAGGIPLEEGTQYTVDYSTGKVQIIDESITNSGKEVKIEYEKADLFNFQTRRLWGTRFDYVVNPSLRLGSTIMSLSERPVLTRVNVADEPANNTILGFDVNYQAKSRFLTRLVDMIPGIQTKQESNINFYGEVAKLFPKGSKRSGETSYIDDFEGTRTAFNFVRSPQVNWKLGSTPQLISGADSKKLDYTDKRAKLAWYNVDNLFYREGSPNRPNGLDLDNHYSRSIRPQDIFKGRQATQVQTNEIIFDMAYFPEERGQYNFNPDLTSNGLLKNPAKNYGSITRAITSDIDFDNANVEYLEFWLLDPFIKGKNGQVLDGRLNKNNEKGGDIYINLGNVSEDIMPDSRHAFENGLPIGGATTTNTTPTDWGLVTNQQYITNAFDNSSGARPNQDVGLDGLKSTEESLFPNFQNFLTQAQSKVTDPTALTKIQADPAGDDWSYYLGGDKDATNAQIVERYKNFNGLEGNSPLAGTSGGFTASATNNPDNEDLNIDNTVSNVEGYYQYKISLHPSQLKVGNKYIIDQVTMDASVSNGQTEKVNWYLFRIPIRQYEQKIGNIEGFKSMRFLRMFLTNFEEPVVLRFAQYQLVASQWRRYTGDLSDRTFTLPTEPYDAKFSVSTVNIEENGAFSPEASKIPYTLPPGAIRDQDVTNPTTNRQINEQSMRLCVSDLRDKDARAAFRNYSLDFLSYKRVKMFIHAEDYSKTTKDGEVAAFVRLGTDFTDNYYEIEVPLKLTAIPGSASPSPQDIWPTQNEIDVAFEDLTNVKVSRNRAGQSVVIPFNQVLEINGRTYRITVVGNPDLSAVQVAMLGVRNPDISVYGKTDDKLTKSVCIWVDEFRISDFDQTAGISALARANIQLADFAQITASASYTTFGFGTINQKISERTRKTTLNYDIAATMALDKFLPEKWGFKIPMFVGYEHRNVAPRYNPLDPDVELQKSLDGITDVNTRNEYKKLVEENFTRRSINFTNVRKTKTNPQAKSHLWDFENLAFTWAYSEEKRTDINTAEYTNTQQHWGIAYNYSIESKPIEPFKKWKFFDSPYLKFLKEFNFSLLPSNISIRGDLDRRYTKTLYRAADRTTNGVDPLFQKNFTFTRVYSLTWNFTKSLNFTYNANINAVIDEPFGELNTKEKRDSVINNLKKLGRMKNFNQQVNFTYRLPFDKFPYMDWLNADVQYNAGYTWMAGAISYEEGVKSQAELFGNIASNSRDKALRGGFDLNKLYQKSKFFASIENLKPTPKKPAPKTDKKTTKDPKAKEAPKDTLPEVKGRDLTWLKRALKPLLMIKRVNFNYSLGEQTVFPGFKPSPKYLGLADLDINAAPGIAFLLGSQDAKDIQRKAIENKWLATDTSQSNPFTQSLRENLTATANLEPFNDFKIQVDFRRTRQANYQEFFRYGKNQIDTTVIEPQSQSPVRTGSYSMSYISFLTAFRSDNHEITSQTFQQFENYRSIIQARLDEANPSAGNYSKKSQDVLIPAFLAAYGKKDPNKVDLSPFPKIPLPNWQIDYAGLSKIPFFQQFLSSFSLRHSYASNYSVNNYTSSLQYGAESIGLTNSELNYPLASKTNDSSLFIPTYVVGQVLISERFTPLLGLNFRTKGNLTIRLDYNKERDLSLNLANAQLSEVNNKSILVSVGFTKANMKLPFKTNGKKTILKNDVDFRLDLTIRDTKTIQRQLDDVAVVTGGNLNFQFRPVISYVVSQQLNLQFYMEQNINDPRVSSSFRRTATSGGIQLRYNITQ